MKSNKTLLKQNQGFANESADNANIDCVERSINTYEKPVLRAYGDVRDITLGPTVGEGESGCAFFFRSGPGGCP